MAPTPADEALPAGDGAAPVATAPTPARAPAGAPADAAAPDPVVLDAAADPVVTAVRQALADVGAQADVVVLDHPPGSAADLAREVPGSAADLAREVGAPAGAVARCALLLADPADPPRARTRAVLVVLVAARPLRTDEVVRLVASRGLPGLRPATAAEVVRLCGCPPEDLPPVGLPLPGADAGRAALEVVDVLVDAALAAHPRLWAPAGRPGTALQVSSEELLRITAGRPVELA
ncbi:aminoacyl-tRNA deacylase [Pseudokineococcus lusitanus]|uniref:Prolyl-tRNA editing enzyme YbaK/EbsC (Cys-tRNA(Pro) deacylase) n=1 Tax=Pseudokineococcus lusitanus TaxID=763993 RepID=A0A3N1HKX1_9ACTN|nr:YbaK/EbsC family protein [Pseudokineococcus lusitanus]ROP43106.1 prolyl-tRNA editing enzyme YbaK/EbsC (Cys-tRNA(Pro) deacylase) [Pseudokineococcus lusitanus]